MSVKQLILLAAIGLLLIKASASADRPNIVVILADDMGIDSVSYANPAMGPLKTPRIDALAKQGMQFSDAHSGSAVCTPTRYGLLTGRYCWRSSLKESVLWAYGNPLIEEDRLTLPEFLRQNGYATGIIGKWHLGLAWSGTDSEHVNAVLSDTDAYFRGPDVEKKVADVVAKIDFSKPVHGGPTERGFDEWYGMDAPNFPPYTWMHNDTAVTLPSQEKPDEMYGHPGPMAPGWKLEKILPTLGNKSAEFITQKSQDDKPFFLYLSLTSPHTPIAPSEAWQGKSQISKYADFIMETDAVVGQVMKAIEDAGVSENTLLIFTTDNGTAISANFDELKKKGVDLERNYRASKAFIYEGGHRVPFVAVWPGKIKAGTSCAETICLNDLFATTADILDKPLPENAAEDSYSILPLITGKATTLPDRPQVVNHDAFGNFAIRKGPWKLVILQHDELYNLADDPKETNNLVNAHPEIVQELKTTLSQYKQNGRSRGVK